MKQEIKIDDGRAFRIVDWGSRYEVSSGGKPATPGTVLAKLKKKALDYVRWMVNGHKLGAGYRKMMETAGKLGPGMDLAVLGLFGKLLELAADQPAELRGWILDNQGGPIDAEAIRYIIYSNDINIVKRGLEVLVDPAVGWVEVADFGGKLAESGESGGKRGKEEEGGGGSLSPAGVDLTDEGTGGEVRALQDETETETNTKTYIETKKPGSVSGFQNLVSRVSVSKLRVADALGINPSNTSDMTTLTDIFAQITESIKSLKFNERVLDEIEKKAAMCRGRAKAIAIFVVAAKEQFGYVPVNRKILKKPKAASR